MYVRYLTTRAGLGYIEFIRGEAYNMQYYKPSECLWMVPGTVDPNDD